MKKIAVLGGGSWGSALAIQLARVNQEIVLYTPEKVVVNEINDNKLNTPYLPGIKFPSNIIATANIEEVINKDIIVIAIPSKVFSTVIFDLVNKGLNPESILLIATKGLIENPVVSLFSKFLHGTIVNKFAFIYGPNLAREVAEGSYSAATIGCVDLAIAQDLAKKIATESFVVEVTNDIITLQIASVIKNIIAILYGMNEARMVKENQKAALIVDALKEIKALSNVMGGVDETLLNYGVLGDLILTCYSKSSRNVRFGYELMKATDKELFLKNLPYLVEGQQSIGLLIELAKQYNLNLPMINSICNNLH